MLKKIIQYAVMFCFIVLCAACKENGNSDSKNTKIIAVKYQPIQIDGMCYDWVNIDPIVTGTQSIESLSVAHDDEYLYFCVKGKDLGPYFDLMLDVDDDVSTGYRATQWVKAGCDYLIENGILYNATGSSWSNWQKKGTDNIIFVANSEVVEMRIARSVLSNLTDTIGIGFWDVNSSWTTENILPESGELPVYDMNRGHDISNPSIVPKVLIPAYFDPNDNWQRLAEMAGKMPGRIVVIANPSNGPGSQLNTRYKNAIDNIRGNKGLVQGYVYSQYGKRAMSSIKADIDTWFKNYSIDGIFIDEQAYTAGSEAYYQEVYNYIKTKKPSALVTGNPGVETIESYLYFNNKPVTDVICIYEDEPSVTWAPPQWTSKYVSAHFCSLALHVDEKGYEKIIDHAYNNNIGWVYSTDDVLPNPWDTLPGYFEDFCEYLVDK